MKFFTAITFTILCISGLIFPNFDIGNVSAETMKVGLYKTFEQSIENSKSYSNKFADVELKCSYTSPTGEKTDFFGFYT